MTRNRALIPGPEQVKYYRQRASAGLIVTEGTFIEPLPGAEWPYVPGIYNKEQISGWRNVVQEVHKAGGKIFVQLWHVGRLTHPLVNPNNELPVGPSEIAAEGGKIPTPEGVKGYVKPRALTLDEIKQKIQLYKRAAENAKEAGFDGVELHGAFGYLPNQFLLDGSNQRTDQYGGSVENRSRFVLEVVEELTSVWGGSKVGVKLSPSNVYNGMKDSDPRKLYNHLLSELNRFNLAYLNLMEPSEMDKKQGIPIPVSEFRKVWKGLIFANNGYTPETGAKAVSDGTADAILFGRSFISNPDLPERIKEGSKLSNPDYSKLYQGGEKGYTDYPTRNGTVE